MNRAAALVLALGPGLAACGGPSAVAPVPAQDRAPVMAPVMAPVPLGADDTCGAAPHAALVGQPATALERELILRQVRLIRPGTPLTRDHVAARINFHIAASPDGSETVTAISCG